ncbi:MAG: argininosuccinate synthase [Thaumarchaeota archaeon]|jgi:argininosuccinate synthase|nr:argininosuccinate synthase [Candidatus Geocrenenecus arthurdayi]MCL7390820.1 argininosuccinate synthase [Candidatus Geocrenenecus arthurdayi]
MKIALAYSGGLDTTVSIKWLQEKYNAEVITVTVDVGQEEDFEEVEERALKSGAIKHYFIDAKKKFAEEYVAKCIKANGLYEGAYPLSSALSRPLIAEEVAKIAIKEGCDAVAHGCTGKGNDQIRFDVTFSAVAPGLRIIAPVREWNMSRDQEIEYALKNGLPINPRKSRFSIDENLWGRSIEAGELEDPWVEPPIEAFKYLKPLDETPSHPQEIVIEFEKGVPISIDGLKMPLEELIIELNKIGGMHGFGYIDHIEDRVVGLKSREVYEAPAALLLIYAHIDLEKMVLNKRILDFKPIIEHKWAEMVYSGLWVDPLMKAIDSFIDETQREVSGEVRVKLFKGSARIIGRRAEKPLYSPEMITYTSKSIFDQKAGEAFSKLWGLSSIMYYTYQKRSINQS